MIEYSVYLQTKNKTSINQIESLFKAASKFEYKLKYMENFVTVQEAIDIILKGDLVNIYFVCKDLRLIELSYIIRRQIKFLLYIPKKRIYDRV